MIPVEIINGGWTSINQTVENNIIEQSSNVSFLGYFMWVAVVMIFVFLVIYFKRAKNEKTKGYNI